MYGGTQTMSEFNFTVIVKNFLFNSLNISTNYGVVEFSEYEIPTNSPK